MYCSSVPTQHFHLHQRILPTFAIACHLATLLGAPFVLFSITPFYIFQLSKFWRLCNFFLKHPYNTLHGKSCCQFLQLLVIWQHCLELLLYSLVSPFIQFSDIKILKVVQLLFKDIIIIPCVVIKIVNLLQLLVIWQHW